MADDETETLVIEATDEGEELSAAEVVEEQAESEQDEADEDEVVVSIGDEPVTEPEQDEEPSPNLVNKLRKLHREQEKASREKDRRIRELEAAAKQPEAEKSPAFGKEPELEDYDYDEKLFQKEHRKWVLLDVAREKAEEEAKAKEQAEADAWQAKLAAFEDGKKALKVRDYDDAEDNIREHFNVTQQGILIQGSDNPALLAYAIGKNPEKAKELASITDPVRFAFAVAKLETQLKVSNRRSAPPPERTLTGKSGAAGSTDKTLDRLRDEAAKTGDYSKVRAHKAALRNS